MKASDIVTKTDKELESLKHELGQKITQGVIDLAAKKSNDTKQVRRLKKDFARVLTAQRARKLEKQDV